MTCIVCGTRCTPMADYEPAVVCNHCDAIQGDILAAAFMVSTPAPAARVVAPKLTRPVESYYGPAAPAVIDQLVDALFPRDRALAGRRAS